VGKNPAQQHGHSMAGSLTRSSEHAATIFQVVLEILDAQIFDDLE
jgi:hypothetical protein